MTRPVAGLLTYSVRASGSTAKAIGRLLKIRSGAGSSRACRANARAIARWCLTRARPTLRRYGGPGSRRKRRTKSSAAANIKPLSAKLSWSGAAFSGGTDQFPLLFQPYLSLQYHDGSGANLPWMQELPDPASSAMWDLPAEIDPRTAERLNIATGDRVRIESPHGSLEAWAYVHPAAIPGVLSMGIGEGHAHYGRYATGRGANPLAIVAATWEPSTGALAFGATRVRVTRLESAPGELAQFSPKDREQGPWGYR